MKLKSICMIALAALVPVVGFGKGEKTITIGDTTLEPGDSMFFSLDEVPDTIGGYEVLGTYLPTGVEVTWTGKKFTVPKAGKVKYSKSEEEFVATSDENPAAVKLSISTKTGKVKGSCKIYVAKTEKKLKAYPVSISGYVGNTLKATIKKVGTVEASLN